MEINQETINLILIFALALSELLAAVPSIKANSIFQLVLALLKKLAPSKA